MAANDLLSIEEARTAINVGTQPDHDDELATFITGLSNRVDALCGPVVVRTVTDEAHDGGVTRIWFDQTPVDSVTTLKEFDQTTETTLTAETNASKPDDAYLLDNIGNVYFAWRRAAGSDTLFPTGRRNVVVTYEAGRYADTASVDEKFKLAASSILRRVWKREQSAWGQTSDFFPVAEDPATSDRFRGFFRAIDPIIREVLADEVLPPASA